jgi:hypothetical protein
MSVIVKCDVCGQICNEGRLNSHKRLAHKRGRRGRRSEAEVIETILGLYSDLSDGGRRLIRARLTEEGV